MSEKEVSVLIVISVEGTTIVTSKNLEPIDEYSSSSPMGHAVLDHEAKKRGLPVVVDSAGTGAYHVDEPPDERTSANLGEGLIPAGHDLTNQSLGIWGPALTDEMFSQYSVPIDHLARAVTSSDFKKFDYILASDSANLANLQRMAPSNSTATIALFGSFGDGKPIADPYYGGINGFEKAYDQCVRYSTGFLDQVFGEKEGVL